MRRIRSRLLRARRKRPRAAAPPSSVMNSRRSHSITSSARREQRRRHVEAEHPGGLGVDDQLELGRLHDRQVGRLRALENATGIDADLTKRVGNVARRSSSARRRRLISRELHVVGSTWRDARMANCTRRLVKKGSVADKKRVGSLAHRTCEGRIDLADGPGVVDLDLQPHGASSRLHVSYRELGTHRIGRIDEYGNASGTGHQLAQEFQPLCHQLIRDEVDTRRVAARPGEAGNKT